MAFNIKKPKGTKDIIDNDINKWYTVEGVAKDVANSFGFQEIRIPTFEETALFRRSVGETTDVVQKEMYSVVAEDTRGSSKKEDVIPFTLRPEGTAGTIRCMLENGMLNKALPQKVFYILSCFRHDNVQKGRLREFHQFGVEMAGSALPSADAEVISLAHSVITQLGIKNVELKLNSIGCPVCRAKYQDALREYFSSKNLCETCKSRLDKNPMRLLDCKDIDCDANHADDAPVILDYLCEECSEHFEKLQSYLKNIGLDYSIDPRIVRGLDYYTKTVFEFVSTDLGAQGTICGGGRYDGLIAQMGGNDTPALGFGMGLERLIDVMEGQGLDFIEGKTCDLYILPMDETAVPEAMKLTKNLRNEGFWVEFDTIGRGVKPQMKYANKLGARYVIVLGDNEINSKQARLKNMTTGEQIDIALDDTFVQNFSNIAVGDMLGDVKNAIN